MERKLNNKVIGNLIFISFTLILIFYWFNVIAMHYIIGISSLLILFICGIIARNEKIIIQKKQILAVVICLFTVFVVVVTHFLVVKSPFKYYYNEVDGGIEITGYKKRIINRFNNLYINIPSHIKGKKVIKLGKRAFANSNDLFEIILPNTVEIIDDEAFLSSEISYITLSKSLKYIGENSLSYTRIDYICLPNSIEYIGKNAFDSVDIIALEWENENGIWLDNWYRKGMHIFYNSVGIVKKDAVVYVLHKDYTSTVADLPNYNHNSIRLLEKVVYENNEFIVSKIGSYAGYSTTFQEIVIPKTIIEICSNAFSNKEIKSIFIPKNVQYIGRQAFLGCKNLVISTEYTEKPDGWDEEWNFEKREVKWDVK